MTSSPGRRRSSRRDSYAKDFLDYRRKRPTPYMGGLRFTPPADVTAERDVRVLSDKEIERAKDEGA